MLCGHGCGVMLQLGDPPPQGASLWGVTSPHGAHKHSWGWRLLVCLCQPPKQGKRKGRFCSSQNGCVGKGKWQHGQGPHEGTALPWGHRSLPPAQTPPSRSTAKPLSLPPAIWLNTQAGRGALSHQGGSLPFPGWPWADPQVPGGSQNCSARAGTLGYTQLPLPKVFGSQPASSHLTPRQPRSHLHRPAATSTRPLPQPCAGLMRGVTRWEGCDGEQPVGP